MDIGVDEAGRGPVMGPLVVAAAGFDDMERLVEAGVRDSKMLTPSKRRLVMEELSDGIRSSVIIIPAEVIDRSRTSMTMNRLEVLAFSSVLASLTGGVDTVHRDLGGGLGISRMGEGPCSGSVILDAADVDEGRFGRDVFDCMGEMIDGTGPEIISRHKADRDHPAVGLASIIAKVTRDREMERISRELKMDTGSGYPSDPVTRRFLEEWVGENGDLPPYCRRTWKTAANLLGKISQTDILSFGD